MFMVGLLSDVDMCMRAMQLHAQTAAKHAVQAQMCKHRKDQPPASVPQTPVGLPVDPEVYIT